MSLLLAGGVTPPAAENPPKRAQQSLDSWFDVSLPLQARRYVAAFAVGSDFVPKTAQYPTGQWFVDPTTPQGVRKIAPLIPAPVVAGDQPYFRLPSSIISSWNTEFWFQKQRKLAPGIPGVSVDQPPGIHRQPQTFEVQVNPQQKRNFPQVSGALTTGKPHRIMMTIVDSWTPGVVTSRTRIPPSAVTLTTYRFMAIISD